MQKCSCKNAAARDCYFLSAKDVHHGTDVPAAVIGILQYLNLRKVVKPKYNVFQETYVALIEKNNTSLNPLKLCKLSCVC